MEAALSPARLTCELLVHVLLPLFPLPEFPGLALLVSSVKHQSSACWTPDTGLRPRGFINGLCPQEAEGWSFPAVVDLAIFSADQVDSLPSGWSSWV